MTPNNRIVFSLLLAAGLAANASAADKATVNLRETRTVQRDSVVRHPWGVERTYHQTTGSVLTIGESELEKRTMNDIRGRLTGAIPGLSITENNGRYWDTNNTAINMSNGPFSIKMRGSGNQVCIVDDVVIPFSQLTLDPNQIESITFLTDVLDKAKYGPIASDGAFLIRTKRGGYNTPMRVHIDLEGGVATTDRVTEWVDGVDYAILNNQARAASGYDQLYSPEAIEAFKSADPYDLTYPNVDYKPLMLGRTLPVSRVGFNLNGGAERVKYNFSLNGQYNGDIARNTATTNFSKLNFSASFTTKIGQWIEAGASISSLVSFRRFGRTEWYNYRSVPAVAYPLTLGNSLGDDGTRFGSTIYGVSRSFTGNHYALGLEGGFRTNRNRGALVNAVIDVDLSWLLPGLRSKTSLGLTNYMYQQLGKNDDFLAYYWIPGEEELDISTHKGVKQSGKSTYSTYTMQSLSMFERLSYDWASNGHKVAVGATFVIDNNSNASSSNYQRQLFASVDALYSYRGKYIVELLGQYAGSSRFQPGKRYGFFPAAGLAWVASEEGFLKDVAWVDNLKLHSQVGLIGETGDLFADPNLSHARYTFANGIWYGPNSKQDSYFGTGRFVSQNTTVYRLANPDMEWSKLFQADLGLDFDFLDGFSFRGAAYYRQSRNRIANTTSQIPTVFGLNGVALYENYLKQTTNGAEVTLGYQRSFGDWRVAARGNVATWEIINDNIVNDLYLYDYQKRSGKPADSRWGFRYIGKYETQEQVDNLPAYSSDVQVGDLMYEDVNKDGVIDANDQIMLGNSSPRLFYGLTLGFGYKNFDFQAVGTGVAGYQLLLNTEYFWNGWGDGNYSAFVRDNLGGAYPRLSYTKSQNNFVASDFWYRDGAWFKLQDLVVSYTIPFRKGGVQSVKISLRGSNLATLSAVKEVDPEAIGAGTTAFPLLRTFTAGLKFNF